MNLQTRSFVSALALQEFVNAAANSVGTITAITFDTVNGKYVLFYTTY